MEWNSGNSLPHGEILLPNNNWKLPTRFKNFALSCDARQKASPERAHGNHLPNEHTETISQTSIQKSSLERAHLIEKPPP